MDETSTIVVYCLKDVLNEDIFLSLIRDFG